MPRPGAIAEARVTVQDSHRTIQYRFLIRMQVSVSGEPGPTSLASLSTRAVLILFVFF